MPLFAFLPFAAAATSLLLAGLSLVPKDRTVSRWCFFFGMVTLGVESLFTGLVLRASQASDLIPGLTRRCVVESLLPATWLGFSQIYSRGDFRASVARWKVPLASLAVLPVALSLVFRQQLLVWAPVAPDSETLGLRIGVPLKALNVALLLAFVWILVNLEHTFRSAVGTMRWRIKFVVIGLAVIFGARLYVHSQALLFPTFDTRWPGIESSALLIGCVLLGIAYSRTGLAEIDVYPSRTVLGSSLTVLVAGGYLFVVGILADIVKRFGGAESFQFQAFVVLLGMAGLGVLLLSDRLRQRLRSFLGRHFKKAEHDSVRTWTAFSRRLANVRDQADLCAVSAKLVSETFEVLSVAIWLADERTDALSIAASTATESAAKAPVDAAPAASCAAAAAIRSTQAPFDLDNLDEHWAEELRGLNPATFPNGGHRWCVPLRSGEKSLGIVVLGDRVNGAAYTGEELQLLQCIADQVTSVLLNLRLAGEVARSRELEAFRTMSAFFAHDLKNAAASLRLMLQNLPVHFDDPVFRADALRGIGNTATRIDEMIGRLTALRQRPVVQRVESDLNQLVCEALQKLDGMTHVELTRDLQPVPRILADREQIQSVVTNLVLNARDAVKSDGRIHLRTEPSGDAVVLTVSDNGCGMSAAFVRDSLFRPFQSTKKKGLGIGMFQSRMIVEAHGGSIRVESEEGKGSTFRMTLPVRTQ